MKSMTLFLCLLGVALADNAALQELTEGNKAFTAEFHKEIVSEVLKGKGNLIASSISAQTVLALTQLGAKGPTASELATGLKLPSTPEKTKEAFKTLLSKLEGYDKFSLNTANKVYVKEGFSIKPEYQALAINDFQADVQSVDFNQKEKAAQTINSWVEQKTNNKITNLVKPDQFTTRTRLVLVNAIYFKANWSIQFNTISTYDDKFFTSAKDEIEVPVMHTTNYFNYYESKKLNAKFLELDYQGGEVKMTIALPNEKEGLAALENQLVDVFAPHQYSKERVYLSMPRFAILSELKLVEVLKNLGIKKVFSDEESDLSGIADTRDPLYVTDVVQKAFINVTEAGTEAAAATAVLLAESYSAVITPEPPKHFNMDHPFLFTISHKTGGILFNGRVVLPEL